MFLFLTMFEDADGPGTYSTSGLRWYSQNCSVHNYVV